MLSEYKEKKVSQASIESSMVIAVVRGPKMSQALAPKIPSLCRPCSRFKYYLLGIFTHFAFNLFCVVVAVVGFSKIGTN